MRFRLSVLLACALLVGDPVLLAQETVATTRPSSATAAASPATQPVLGDLYYLDDCPQCGAMLGTRGDVVEREYDGRQLRFCQEVCRERFEAQLPGSRERIDARLIEDQNAAYPLQTCLVTGRPLDGQAVAFIFRNRLIRVADAASRERFEADPAAYWRALNEAADALHGPRYEVTKCPVQGTVLEGEAKPGTTVVIANRLVKTCCRDCAKFVRSKPSHFLPLIDSAHRLLRQDRERKARQSSQ